MNFDSVPIPPDELKEPRKLFLPDSDMPGWILDTFVDKHSELHNPEHEHLQNAVIGCLWTNTAYESKGRRILGTAERPRPNASKWSAQRSVFQLGQWFGVVPDFVITLSAPYFRQATNPQRCALIEHELYHCAQAKDKYGAPRFSKQTGRPIFTIKGHDVEEFVGVVRRYGAGPAGVKEMVDAANQEPILPAETIEGICGTCLKEVA